MNRDCMNLNIATCPEALGRAVNFAARKINEPVYFLIAERKQLREFLMKHYPVPEYLMQFSETF